MLQTKKVYSHEFFRRFMENHKEHAKPIYIPHPLEVIAKKASAQEAIIRVEFFGRSYQYEPSKAYKRYLGKHFQKQTN